MHGSSFSDVRPTIGQVASRRNSTEVVDVERAAVPDPNTCRPAAAVARIVKTDRPGDLPLRHCGLSTAQPAGGAGATPVRGNAGGRHSGARGALEAKPAWTEPIVTATYGARICQLPVVAGKAGVGTTLCFEVSKKIRSNTLVSRQMNEWGEEEVDSAMQADNEKDHQFSEHKQATREVFLFVINGIFSRLG